MSGLGQGWTVGKFAIFSKDIILFFEKRLKHEGNGMFANENSPSDGLPLYEVRELTLEEALLVLAADREVAIIASGRTSPHDDKRYRPSQAVA